MTICTCDDIAPDAVLCFGAKAGNDDGDGDPNFDC